MIYAIFMLIIFSFIGVTLVNMLSGENISSAEELNSTKAFFLAESGVEIAMAKNLTDGNYLYKLDSGTINIEVKTIIDDSATFPPVRVVEVISIGRAGEMKRKIETKFRVD
ncbi:MAG: pilus assembly PilX N-terminal domain-containing protein [Deferribacterales bacterium]